MELNTNNKKRRLTYWTASLELLLTFALLDAAVIAWMTHLASGAEILAVGLAYTMIALGVMVTVYAAEQGPVCPATIVRTPPAPTRNC